jgi:glycosyltransferase involved in cell wall biosynthesis
VAPAPAISIVIPVFEEEGILHAAIVDLRERLSPHGLSIEIVLAENGSTDGTVEVARTLAAKFPEVRWISIDEPNYGAALRRGIEEARAPIVVCEEIDLCDVDFLLRAVALLEQDQADFVVGSKLLPGARDERPALRHAASVVYSAALRGLLGFRGTDTHGLKAFRRDVVLPILRACLVDKDVLASELVLRAERAGVRLLEIPVRVKELRPPSIDLVRRLPGVATRLARLWWAMRR